MLKILCLIFLISFNLYAENRIYTAIQLGGIDWVGFIPDYKYDVVNGFFLSGEIKYEFHPSFNIGVGSLVTSEWCFPFGCGYKPENVNRINYIESGWVLKKWNFEIDIGPHMGLAYKTGPGPTIAKPTPSNTEQLCLALCLSEDIATKKIHTWTLNPGFYYSLIYNLNDFAFGFKHRWYFDDHKFLNAFSIYLGARISI